MDLFACIPQGTMDLWRGDIHQVSTGIAVEIPHGCEGQIRPRSSMGRRGIIIPNAPGTIDSDYRGEIMILLMYLGPDEATVIRHGDRIAQLVIVPVLQVGFNIVDDFDASHRGEGGFGSTGKS